MAIRRATDDGHPGFSPNFLIGLALVVLAFFTVLANIALYRQTSGLTDSDTVQRNCIKTSFAELTDALQVRSEFTRQINDLRDQELALLARGRDLNADQINAIGSTAATLLSQPQPSRAVIERSVRDLLIAKDEYRRGAARVARRLSHIEHEISATLDKQNNTPIPPFPGGSCPEAE